MTSESKQCSICLDKVLTFGKLNSCEHDFHFKCIKKWSKLSNRCPTCRVTFSEISHQKREKILKKVKVSEVFIEESSEDEDFLATCFVCGDDSLEFIVNCQGVECENFAHIYCLSRNEVDNWYCDECELELNEGSIDEELSSDFKYCDICNKLVEEGGKSCSEDECAAVAHFHCLNRSDYDFWLCKICEHVLDDFILEEKTRMSLSETKHCEICNNIVINGGKFCDGYYCVKKAHFQCLYEEEKFYWECETCDLVNPGNVANKEKNVESSEPKICEKVINLEKSFQISEFTDFGLDSKAVIIQSDNEESIFLPKLRILDEKDKFIVISSDSESDLIEIEDKSGVQFIRQSQQAPLKTFKDKGPSGGLCVNLNEICELPQKRKHCDKEKEPILGCVREWVRSELENIGEVNLGVGKVFRAVVKLVAQNGGDFGNRDRICKAVQEFVAG